jgi:hypothetical protein
MGEGDADGDTSGETDATGDLESFLLGADTGATVTLQAWIPIQPSIATTPILNARIVTSP